METQGQQDDSQGEQTETTGDESAQEFAEQVENDPSTAQSGEDELEEVRGG